MRFFFLVLLAFITVPKFSSSQSIQLINSGEVIKNGLALYDSAKYKSALLEFDKVNRSDTNYVYSLYTKALTCEADSQYQKALNYCREGLALKEQREHEPEIYNTYGNVLNEMGQSDKAIAVFDSAIVKYPSFSLFYFNKGVALLSLKRLADAELMFKKTLLINPYMYSAHYELGLTALEEGKIIPASLSFIGYLLVNPAGKYWSKSVNFLAQISKSTDEILTYKNKRTAVQDENYAEVEDIVLSKIALDNSYKPIIHLDDPVSRQIQAIFEKINYSESDNDFWMQYYIPYYKKVYSSGQFELFINQLFSNVNVPQIQNYVKKNEKELKAFRNDIADYFNLIQGTRQLTYKSRDTVTNRYYYENGVLVGKGVLINNKTLVGPWSFYYPAGNTKCVGNYNSSGEKEGEWTFYFYPETLKAIEIFKNGKLEGVQKNYFDNGNISSVSEYKNDLMDGLVTTYYYSGIKKSISNYKLGKKDGAQKVFHSNGNISESNNYTAGVISGTSYGYFKSGKLKQTEQYVDGKEDGPYKSYNENGTLSAEGQFVKDKGEGEWKYYDSKGKINEKRHYVNNVEEGLREEYYDNGQLSASYNWKKTKIDGEADFYAKDGKLYDKYVYDGGLIKSAVYNTQSGAQINVLGNNNGVPDVVNYSYDGIKESHVSYNKKGDFDGPDTLFYPSGKIKEINMYKDGALNGNSVSYYLNGNKKSEGTLKDGKNNGLYTNYYVNGKVESEGWLIDGDYQGEWRYYDELGRLSSKLYYLDNDLDGYREDYNAGGEKLTEEKYHFGWLEKLTQYDSAGNIINTKLFPKANGKYTLIYPNGQVMVQGDYVNGDFDGAYKTYYYDGTLEKSFYYNKGMLDSTYLSYYYGGIKSYEGHYSLGNKTGVWKNYSESGKLNTLTNYQDDQKNGEEISYFEDGNKEMVSLYKNDVIDGTRLRYDPEDGALAYQTNFENGDAKSYTYLGKDGKLVPFIPINSKNGILKAYYANGNLSRLGGYYDGELNGSDFLYYDNNQVRSQDTTAYGMYEGVSKEYYKNGKLKSRYQYKTDNATGVCTDYNPNGTIKREVTCENGVDNGPAKYYDENGKLVKTMIYHYGVLIAVKNEK